MRVFLPLAQLGPLRALTASARALSETLGLNCAHWKEMQAHKPKMEGNEAPVSQNAKSHKAKVQGNEGPHSQNIRKSMPKRPKWTEIKAQKAKMKGNRGAKDQNERNCALQGRTRPKQGMTRPKRPK